MEKTQLHKPQPIEIVVAIVWIVTAIVTFIRIPQAFILEALLLMITVVYVLACVGFFDDTDTEQERRQNGMTTITIYRNKRNKNKYIEVHNDGYYHNSVKQFMQWKKDHNGNQLAKPIRNEMGDRVLHRWKKANLMELLEDYELITAQKEGMEIMKDYRTIIDNDTVEMFCTTLDDYLADSFEGCMLDNYFFDVGNNNMRWGRIKLRKYVMILEKSLNEWSSVNELYMTDSEKKYRELLDMYYKDREEYEKEETAQEEGGNHERKRIKNRKEVWNFR